MTPNPTSPNAAWYSLRRTLVPWQFEELLAELLEQVERYRVDEVILKLDTEEFSHGHPTLEWAKEYQKKLFYAKAELEKRHVRFSLNPWITVGHCDRGRDDRKKYPEMRFVVGHDGTECRHCACPLSEGWREHLKALWSIYGETHPHVMWVEDDIRTFNHEPVRFGCFCPEHMRRFSKLVGKTVTREELVAAMLAPGEAHPYRKIYMEMQREIMIDTVKMIAQTVHAVAPDCCMGLMSSGPRQHNLEGRDWQRFATALADGKQLYSRPPMGVYCEDSMRGFYYSHDSIKLTRHALPDGIIEQTEVENVPFTRFSKSIAATFQEMAISFAYGSHGVTMNLFDHVGTPMEREAAFGRMLGAKKDYLNALALASQQPGKFCGVQLLFHEDASKVKQVQAHCDYQELSGDGYAMMNALENAGIATGYEESSVIAVSGQTLRCYTDAEIEGMLHKGLFLDAVAAQVLLERGFGDDIGLKSVGVPRHRKQFPFVISAEAWENEALGGSPRKYLTATLPYLGGEAHFAELELAEGAEALSTWVDADAQVVMTALSVYTNRFGGRVAVHGLDYETAVGVSYHHTFRREQLHFLIRYLAFGKPELEFSCDGSYALAYRKDCETYTLCGVFNLTLDDFAESCFQLRWEHGVLPQVERLMTDGSWQRCTVGEDGEIKLSLSDGLLTIKYQQSLDYHEPLVLKIYGW